MRGVNYVPSWTSEPPLAWGAHFQPDRMRRELDFARGVGFDAVRVFLAPQTAASCPDYIDNVAVLLDGCAERDLAAVIVLTDSCGYTPAPGTPWSTVEAVRAASEGSEQRRTLDDWAGDRDLFGAAALVPVRYAGRRDDAMAAIWEGWTPSPPYDQLRPLGRWVRFGHDIADVAEGHPAVVGVELCNEPFLTPRWAQREVEPVAELYLALLDTVRDVAPGLPVSIGAVDTFDFVEHDARAGRRFDFASVHCYHGQDRLRDEVSNARSQSGERPVLISEWGCFPGRPDEGHLADIVDRFEVLRAAGCGWFCFHLIAGYGPFGLSALLYPNGVMRPAARYLRDRLAA